MPLKPITLEAVSRIAVLVVAPSGMGKTCLIRTLLGQVHDGTSWVQVEEPPFKVCVLSAESGLLSVRDLVAKGLVEGFEIGSQADMTEAYHFLAHNPEAKARYAGQWIVIDSLTEIAQRCEEKAKADNPGADAKFKLWGQYSDDLTGLIKGFRDLTHCNVLLTCLPDVDKDENGRRFIGTDLAGKKIKGRLVSYFDEVLYLDVFPDAEGNQRRALLTQPWDRMPAKDRSGCLAWLEEPNLLTVYRKIMGGLTNGAA